MMKFMRDRMGHSVSLKGITISNAQANFHPPKLWFRRRCRGLRHARMRVGSVRPHLFNGCLGTRASGRRSADTEEALWRAQTRWAPRSAVQLPPEATDAGDLSFERVIFFGLRPDDAQGSACGSRKGRF